MDETLANWNRCKNCGLPLVPVWQWGADIAVLHQFLEESALAGIGACVPWLHIDQSRKRSKKDIDIDYKYRGNPEPSRRARIRPLQVRDRQSPSIHRVKFWPFRLRLEGMTSNSASTMDIHDLVQTQDHQIGEVVGFTGLPKGFVLVRVEGRRHKLAPRQLRAVQCC